MTTQRRNGHVVASGVRAVMALAIGVIAVPPLVGSEKASRAVRLTSDSSPTTPSSELPQQQPRRPDGDGGVAVEGESRQWHKLTVTLDGPYAHELDNEPNPFVDYEMNVTFTHESGSPSYVVPGYFAADGDAADSSAESGTKWRAHLSADKPGRWDYKISFRHGETIIDSDDPESEPLAPYDGTSGQFDVAPSDKSGRDLRAHGRLQYVKERYLKFAGTGEYFLKAGADAPETLLAYVDFDGTVTRKPQKSPLKTWGPHVRDWRDGDPTWQDDKGKGLIGAINYLSGKGCNAFSFLTYNAGGDGDNVWPFVERDDKMHYDCSKLDQWGIVFDHGTARGMYLHFKMQETENDDHRLNNRNDANVPESLDGGDLGPQRRLYCRELIARFGHNLALNWNLGEENTQSTEQQKSMIDYLARVDPYGHPIVVHTYPNRQDDVYRPLIGDRSELTGVSLQNGNVGDTHWQVIKWVRESEQAGKPWVVAFDESGNAAHGQPPDLGYKGFDGHDRQGKETYTEHRVRRETLWGTLLGGGGGVEYYFGYQFVENDLVCEDWRSRDRSWDYCRIALDFFRDHQVPFHRMRAANELVDSDPRDNRRYCFADLGELYLAYVADGAPTSLDLREAEGRFSVMWFNPRTGGDLTRGSVETLDGGGQRDLGTPPTDPEEDWLAVIRKR